jgi:hypothetical protein
MSTAEELPRGPVLLPGGRIVWWTGKVAIGLRRGIEPPLAHEVSYPSCTVCAGGLCPTPQACSEAPLHPLENT